MKLKYLWMLVIVLGLLFSATAQDEISIERKQAVDSLALEKVRDLSKYISIIGSKETDAVEYRRVSARAEELFMTGSEIGVSSLLKSEIKYFTVGKYFERLNRLNYSKVEIEWYNIEYMSDLQKQPDGTYVGVITIFQKFKGYDAEGRLIYQDTTKKDITVYVKRKETQIGGRLIGFWDVLLGDMRVKETSK